MEPFEYVMALVSIVVGLGITHILSAMGEAIHRLRGHGAPIRLDAVWLLWVGFILIWLIGFWWAEFKFQSIGMTWTYGSYLFVVTYAIFLFLVAVILVPVRMEQVTDSYAYFMDGRAWFFGALIVANVLDFFDALMKGVAWASRTEYLLSQSGPLLLVCVIGLLSANRIVHIVIAAIMFVAQLIYVWLALNVLGSW